MKSILSDQKEELLFRNVALLRSSFRIDGGGERQFLNYISAFHQLSDSITVVSGCTSATGKVFPLPYEAASLSVEFDKRMKRVVSNITAQQKFDFIHSHEWTPGADSVRIGDGLHSIFLERMRSQGSVLTRLRFLSCFHKRKLKLERETLTHLNLRFVISPSQMCLDEFEAVYPSSSTKRGVIFNPVDPRYLGAPLEENRIDGRLKIIFVGSGWRRKGLDLLLSALGLLTRPFVLSVIGSDPHSDRYKKLSQNLSIDRYIEWVGVEENLAERYRNADLLVLPALYEPTGNVVTEALALGCKVIVSDCVGNKEFVNEVNGCVVPNTIESLHEAIELFQPAESRQAVRASVSHLTFDNFRNSLFQFYAGEA